MFDPSAYILKDAVGFIIGYGILFILGDGGFEQREPGWVEVGVLYGFDVVVVVACGAMI